MSALKSVIITLPAKTATTPNIIDKTASSKLNFTTSILMDKIKLEAGTSQQQQQQHLQQSSKKQLSVQSPVKHMELDGLVFKQESSRGKKRRLDHLTWEEKLQRKKLKNRVAAQTSRDRKKAKLDELEDTVRLLREQNERLIEECSILRTQNESLVSESKMLKQDNKDLMEMKERQEEATATSCSACQARVGCTVPALGSAVSPLNPLQQGGTVQTARALTLSSNASILLKILTLYLLSKTCLANSKPTMITSSDSKNLPKAFCERLPLKWKQILLSQMSRSVTQSSVKKESTEKFDDTEKMVGQASSYVEADTSRGGVTLPTSTTQVITESITQIVPAVTLNSSGPITIAENIEIKEEPMHNAEMVYGTYDEATNCITIIYPEDEVTTRLSPNNIPIQGQQVLASPSHSYDSMSPASLHFDDADVAGHKLDCAMHSDGGYESHGSPASSDVGGTNSTLTDLWHESFSELFPSLA